MVAGSPQVCAPVNSAFDAYSISLVVPVIFPFEPPAVEGAAPASPAGAAGPPALAMLQAMVLGVVVPSFHW